MVNLYVNYYLSDNEERQKEIDLCLQKNIDNPHIDKIYVLTDHVMALPESEKISQQTIHCRPLFKHFISCINSFTKEDDVNIIANSDIYFNDTLNLVNRIRVKECFALSRYEWDVLHLKHILYDCEYSQDVWIWRGKVDVNLQQEFGLGYPGCLSGDIIVKYNRGNRVGGRPISISDFYKKFNGLTKDWDTSFATFIQSLNNETGEIFYNSVLGVYQSGVKDTIRINFDNGSHLVLTPDHEIAIGDNSFLRADLLTIGDVVLCRGSMLAQKKEGKKLRSLRTYVYIQNHPFAYKVKLKGHQYNRMPRHRLSAEAKMNGLSYEAYLHILNNEPDRIDALKFLTPNIEVHHVDENPLNDNVDNLQILTKAEHARLHSKYCNFNTHYLDTTKVISIEKGLPIMTYDIQMESPMNNFCANKIIVHNCDNAIAKYIEDSGYEISNPSRSIMACHVHASDHRTYTDSMRVQPPYKFVRPCEIDMDYRVLHLALNMARQDTLCDALASMGKYMEIDWIQVQAEKGTEGLRKQIIETCEFFRPDLVFMQIQGEGVIDAETASRMKGKLINWTGDVRNTTPQWFFDIGQYCHTMFTNTRDVDVMREHGFKADYLQIGFDHKIFCPDGIALENAPEIVFMGNNHGNFSLSEFRKETVTYLDYHYKHNFGVYGAPWTSAKADLMFNLYGEAAVYRGCKIAINLSHFQIGRYSSDRIFRLMGAGAFCLSHYYPDIEKEFTIGEHLDVWHTLEELHHKIEYYRDNEGLRRKIAHQGCQHVHNTAKWAHRINQLKNLL